MLTPPVKASIISFCLLAAAILSSFAGTPKEFSGATKGDWFEPTNWTPEGVPTSDDDVAISGKEVLATNSIVAGSIALSEAAILKIGDAQTRTNIKQAPHVKPNVTVDITGDLTLTDASKLYVYAGTLADTNAFHEAYKRGEAYTNAMAAIWAGRNTVTVGGAFSVDGNSFVYPDNEPITGTPVAFTCRTFFLGEGSTVSVARRGWDWSNGDWADAPAGAFRRMQEGWKDTGWTWAFGPGWNYQAGGGYGGNGQGTGLKEDGDRCKGHYYGKAYGYSFAPFLSGSPSGAYRCFDANNDDCRGAGSFILYAADGLTVNGLVDATSPTPGDDYSGASGGGIWLATGADEAVFGPNARLQAKGARCRSTSSYSSTGAGGRIALAQGVSPAQVETLAAGALPAGYVETSEIPGVTTDVTPGAHPASATPLAQDGTVSFVQSSLSKVPISLRLAGAGAVIVDGTRYTEDVIVKVLPGSEVTLDAEASDGWDFAWWMGTAVAGGYSAVKAQTLTVTEAVSLVANFMETAGAARTWTGASSAEFRNGLNWSPLGAPGTNDDLTVAGVHDLRILGEDNSFGSLTVGDKASVTIGDLEARVASELQTVRDLVVRDGAKFTVVAPEMDDVSVFAECDVDANGDYSALYPVLWAQAKHITVGGTFAVSNATVFVDDAPVTGVPVVFDIAGDVSIDAAGKVTAQDRGWTWKDEDTASPPAGAKKRRSNGGAKTRGWTYAPGSGHDYQAGGGYGGTGRVAGQGWTYAGHSYGGAYGFAFAPFLPGSPSGWFRDSHPNIGTVTPSHLRGGGQVALLAQGDVVIDGTIDASVSKSYIDYTGAGGGGIWLAGASFAFGDTARLLAYGGDSSDLGNYAPGAGGRIALAEGLAPADLATCASGALPDGFTDWGVIDCVSNNVACGWDACRKKWGVVDAGTVSFVRAKSVPIPVSVTIDGVGSVTVAGETHATNFTCYVTCGDDLGLTATPEPGVSRFISWGWSGQATPSGASLERTVTMPAVAEPLALVAHMPAGVGTRTWTGARSAYLDDRGNWEPEGDITDMDALVIPTGKSVQTTNDFTAYSITLQGSATLTCTARPTEGGKTFAELYAAATRITLPGGLFVRDTAKVKTVGDSVSGAAVRLDVGAFELAETAAVDATGTGWYWFEGDVEAVATQGVYRTYAPGAGAVYSVGGGYGGGDDAAHGRTYGFAAAPFLPGSPNGIYNAKLSNAGPGGGVVWVNCSGTVRLDGTVKADGKTGSIYGEPSGGGVWITAKSFVPGTRAHLSVRGASTAHTYTSAGGGGRVAVGVGLSSAEIDALATGATDGVFVKGSLDTVATDVRGGESSHWIGDRHYFAPSGTTATAYGRASGPVVEVVSDGVLAQGVEPAYGAHAVRVGDLLAAPEYGVDPDDAGIRYACTGHVLRDAAGAVVASGAGRSVSVPDGDGPYFLTWTWATAENHVVLAKPEHATLTVNGVVQDADFVTDVADGGTLTVTVKPDDGYQFLAWSGDAPWGQEFAATATFAVTKPMALSARIRAYAAPTTRTWNSGSTASWFENKWTPSGLPGPEDTVVIPGGTCYLTDAVRVGALSVTGGSLGVTKDGPAVLEVTGDAALSGGETRVGVAETKWNHRLTVGGDLTLSGSAILRVTAGPLGGDFTYATGASFVEVAGTFALTDTARFIPISRQHDGASVKVTCGAFDLAAEAKVDATGVGYGWVDGVTPPVNNRVGSGYAVGAGHGAKGVWGESTECDEQLGEPYGFRLSPVEPGAPNGCYQNNTANVRRGGGLVRIHAKAMSVAGSVLADAKESSDTGNHFGGAAGGGIWLTADDFTFASTAKLSAHGGKSTYSSMGAGGRIAIGRGLAADQIAALAETGRCPGVGSPDRHTNEKRLAAFFAAYPDFDAENGLNLDSGCMYNTRGEKTGDPVAKAEGTFDFYEPKGVLLIVR